MHDTSLLSGSLFAKTYAQSGQIVIDIGSMDVGGCLRNYFEEKGATYIGLDMEEGKNVDIIVKPGERLPFDDESIDIVVTTSCFEHDPCFWMTFRELCRVVKKGGYIYASAPSSGPYHTYPGDNWRFYSDAGQALAFWSAQNINGSRYPVSVVESFHIHPIADLWIDYVCIWKKTNIPETEITLKNEVKKNIGPLRKSLLDNNCKVEVTLPLASFCKPK